MAYRYYRINVTANNGFDYLMLAKIQVYYQRLAGMKVSATDLSVSQGTVNIRVKNLAESPDGRVLIDLPKSDNTQGLQVGIANDGKICLTDDTTTVYGPNKSTLQPGMHSLAWV